MKSFSVGRSVIFSLALAVFCPSQAREGVFDVATAGGSTISLDFINPDIVRVTTILPGENPGEATPASVLTPVPFTGNVTEDTSHFFAVTTSAGLRVAVDKTTGSVSLTAGRAGVLDLGERKICPCGKRRSLIPYSLSPPSSAGACPGRSGVGGSLRHFPFGGTGSSPGLPKGLQRRMRQVAKRLPLSAPCTRSASMA